MNLWRHYLRNKLPYKTNFNFNNMKPFYTITLLIFTVLSLASCTDKAKPASKKSNNFIVILDLSDRILNQEQLDKDIYLIQHYFQVFEKKSRKNLVLNSKNRFSIKIIPQKNSPLNYAKYEDLLHFYLDETDVIEKDKKLKAFGESLPTHLRALKTEAMFGKTSKDYFGVDIWAYLYDNASSIEKPDYENTILVLTDGYFDFESQTHVIKEGNKYTSTRFLKYLNSSNWKEVSKEQGFGLLPIKLGTNSRWIVAGIHGKNENDILQTEKISYFWKKWLSDSGVGSTQLILNSAKSQMCSQLINSL